MIASLTGQVRGHDERTIRLDVHGVGMRIFVLPRLLERVGQGDETITVFTHLQVREDALELYGFLEAGELRLFEKLLTVSGVGPKVALGVMSAASVTDLEQAIEQGQSSLLTKVSGVGKKTAERIIVDLRGKLAADQTENDSDLSAVIDALVSLGYSTREAREAATATAAGGRVEDRIKTALKRMGSR